MADSFNKKEREKKRQKRKRDKAEKRERKKLEPPTRRVEFMYLDEDGQLTEEKPDLTLRKKTKIEDIEVSTPKKDKSIESKFGKTGVVKFFNTEKGYGFIVDNETSESYFVHVDDLKDSVNDNDRVTFEAGKGPKGPKAIEVKLVVG